MRKLVELHGGTVEAFSVLGRGSEFVVRLPLLQHSERQPAPIPSKKQSSNSLKVLVVDDNEDMANSLAILLQISGHDVRTAHSGPAALETADKLQPNLVLLDIGLPGMDGYEVAERLRQNPKFTKVRLVAVTGYGLESERRRSQKSGFDAHLVKPIKLQELQDVLASVSAGGV